MLSRWCNEIFDINLALSMMHRIVQRSEIVKGGRGAKPKRNISVYALAIALKEYDERTLRGAEVHITRLVCNERIDHSVISYWENKEEMAKIIAQFICVAGAMLEKYLSSLFTFVDATKFSDWHMNEINIHVCNRIANKTVYPIGISFLTKSVSEPVDEAVPEGEGLAYLDAGYDDNKTIGVMFQKGYTPIVCPNKNRWKGYWRKKARKLYRMREHRLGYRQRSRGESLFGSLTNQFGDRFNVRNEIAMQTRVTARIYCYQIKLLIRCENKVFVLIVRHAPLRGKFINHLFER
jgi:hypothetical protein